MTAVGRMTPTPNGTTVATRSRGAHTGVAPAPAGATYAPEAPFMGH
jgi:hypothetical protein